MPITERNGFYKNAHRVMTATAVAGVVGFGYGVFKIGEGKEVQTGAIEAATGLSVAAIAVFGGKTLIDRDVSDFAQKRKKEVLKNPADFPLHLIDIFLDDQEKLVRSKESQERQKNPSASTIKHARELLRRNQITLQKDFGVNDDGSIVRTQRSQKGIYQSPNGSLQIILVNTNINEARAVADMISKYPRKIREYIPGRDQEGLLFNARSSPTQWEGVSVGLYSYKRIGDDAHVVVSFNKEKSKALVKEKTLPFYISQ